MKARHEMPTADNLKPNIFIVGAARSGTTSLWQYLRQHPDIYMPEDELYKEPGYFAAPGVHMGFDNYMNIFPDDLDKYKFVGEASTAYLTDPTSAKRLFDFNPHAKIIILLRNPADRAYSLYNWMVQDGYEYANTFEEALSLENIRSGKQIPNWFEPQYFWNYLYFQSGLYYEQVKRYLDFFGDNTLIIQFEHFKRDTLNVCNMICSFLGLKKHAFDVHVHNPSRGVLSPKIQFLLRKLNDIYHTSGRQLLISGEEWPFADVYRQLEQQLSSVSHFSFKDRILSGYVMYRLKMFFQNEYRHTRQVDSKEIRDQLLTIGLSHRKPRRLNGNTKKLLMSGCRSDVERLSALTGMKLTGWLSS